MTFDYLWTLYVHVCGINDPGHTCDEYLILLVKLDITLNLRVGEMAEEKMIYLLASSPHSLVK
jgi:hypothetical protein